MEYIIKVSDFDKNNSDINSIKPLSCSNESRSSDDDDYEEQENTKSTLTTVCGTLDQEATDKLEESKCVKSSEPKEKCKNQANASKKCVNSDELKLSHYKKLYHRASVSSKSMENEKIIYEAYTNHVRFSQEMHMNLDIIDKLDGNDILNKVMLNISDTFAKTTSTTDNLDDKKY